MTRPVEISVVTPFRDAEKHMAGLLESLVAQRVGRPWELVLVDNKSADASRRIAEGYAQRLPIRVVDAPDGDGVAYARNVGVAHSAGRKLMFVDADDALAPGYIAAMAEALDRSPFVTSRVDSESLNPEWVRTAHGPYWQADGVAVFYDFLPAAGSNIGIDRQLFERLGGLSTEFGATEDIAFSWSAQLDEHVHPLFVEAAVYQYRYRHTLRALVTQGMLWGRSSVLLYRRFRHLGMPGRSLRVAIGEWRAVGAMLVTASSRSALAPVAARFGACLGRLIGSVRYGIPFF